VILDDEGKVLDVHAATIGRLRYPGGRIAITTHISTADESVPLEQFGTSPSGDLPENVGNLAFAVSAAARQLVRSTRGATRPGASRT
jgi:hypothetical protein